nr:hypothetical protein [Tanacetum cinerariifolium]
LWNSPLFKAFQVTADVPEIYMQEFWTTAKLHHNSIRFKIDTRKSVLDLEAFREMLHISPRIPNQPFAVLPTEEEILDFLRDFITESTLTLPISSGKILCIRRNRINWHYVRDDALFSTIKVVSRHQTTQQYGAILPIELTTDEIRNNKDYKEYYACAMGEAVPKPKARTGSKPGVPDVPSDDSEEELSWNSFNDEDVGGHEEGNKSDESDDDRDEGSDDDS